MFFNLNTYDLKNPKYKQNTFNKTFYNKKIKQIFSVLHLISENVIFLNTRC